MWTHFHDMRSGGGQKLDWPHIYIEAPEHVAIKVFYNMFGRNPNRVTCTCCGEDYSISEDESLEQITAYQRGCEFNNETNQYVESPTTKSRFRSYQTLDAYKKSGEAKIIPANEITEEMKIGDVPEQGYVWVD